MSADRETEIREIMGWSGLSRREAEDVVDLVAANDKVEAAGDIPSDEALTEGVKAAVVVGDFEIFDPAAPPWEAVYGPDDGIGAEVGDPWVDSLAPDHFDDADDTAVAE